MNSFPDRLAYYIFMSGYSFGQAATMLTGAQPGTPEHDEADRAVEDAVRRIAIQIKAAQQPTIDEVQQ